MDNYSVDYEKAKSALEKAKYSEERAGELLEKDLDTGFGEDDLLGIG